MIPKVYAKILTHIHTSCVKYRRFYTKRQPFFFLFCWNLKYVTSIWDAPFICNTLYELHLKKNCLEYWNIIYSRVLLLHESFAIVHYDVILSVCSFVNEFIIYILQSCRLRVLHRASHILALVMDETFSHYNWYYYYYFECASRVKTKRKRRKTITTAGKQYNKANKH